MTDLTIFKNNLYNPLEKDWAGIFVQHNISKAYEKTILAATSDTHCVSLLLHDGTIVLIFHSCDKMGHLPISSLSENPSILINKTFKYAPYHSAKTSRPQFENSIIRILTNNRTLQIEWEKEDYAAPEKPTLLATSPIKPLSSHAMFSLRDYVKTWNTN